MKGYIFLVLLGLGIWALVRWIRRSTDTATCNVITGDDGPRSLDSKTTVYECEFDDDEQVEIVIRKKSTQGNDGALVVREKENEDSSKR